MLSNIPQSCSRDRDEAPKAKKDERFPIASGQAPQEFYLKAYHTYGENKNRGKLAL